VLNPERSRHTVNYTGILIYVLLKNLGAFFRVFPMVKLPRMGRSPSVKAPTSDPQPAASGEVEFAILPPLQIASNKGKSYSLCVDRIAVVDGRLAVLGWTDAPSLRIEVDGQRLSVEQHARSDVTAALKLPEGTQPGFAAIGAEPFDQSRAGHVILTITLAYCSPYVTAELAVAKELGRDEMLRLPRICTVELSCLASTSVGTPAWRDLRKKLPQAVHPPAGIHGFIEAVFASPEGGLIAVGWALHPADCSIWIEDEFGAAQSLENGFRRRRSDVSAAFVGLPWADMESGFVLHLPDMEARALLSLCAATPNGVVTLATAGNPELLPAAPAAAAKLLFSIETEDHLFHRRVSLVDMQVLGPLIARRQAEMDVLPVTVTDFGKLPANPEVSIIIPLYRRFDFIEHQLAEFAGDTSLMNVAEIIYVIDDPSIEVSVIDELRTIHALFGVAVRVVYGGGNRGFSGANNLGARYATSERLLFLNSDVIPQGAGWLPRMISLLDEPKVGIVGAMLTYPDGSIQHAGMEFRKYDAFNIWTNYHTDIGTMPSMIPRDQRPLPAVTGACMLIDRSLFEAVGQWDTHYLIGDFEDSDLCLAVRKRGYRILCCNDVSLVHLERQSFSAVGADAFRNRMTIFNAVRHETRWHDLLTRPVTHLAAVEVQNA
jgi:O-antigen biosynthesis protein